MKVTMPQPGGAVLLWFGVFGGPIAWGLQLVTGFTLTQATCSTAGTHWTIHLDAWTIAVTALAALATTAAWTAAFATFRATRDAGSEPPSSRIRFLAVIAATVTPLFLAMILMSGIGSALLVECTQG
jgi:hypothetical protein